MDITHHPYVKACVTAQIALDLPENKENTGKIGDSLLSSPAKPEIGKSETVPAFPLSMFDAAIGQIKGELSSY